MPPPNSSGIPEAEHCDSRHDCNDVTSHGRLIKTAEALERFEKVDTLVVDKTGTLSEGKPRVVAVVSGEEYDEAAVFAFAASLERSSEHPLAAVVAAWANERGFALQSGTDFRSETGKGVVETLSGHAVAVGNAALLDALGVSHASLKAPAERLRNDGAATMFVAIDGRSAGVVAIADPVKPSTPGALEALRREGIRIVMVTGDHRATAEAVARRLGINDIEAQVLADRKNAIVQRLRDEGRAVAMAGAGVNAAPALAAS